MRWSFEASDREKPSSIISELSLMRGLSLYHIIPEMRCSLFLFANMGVIQYYSMRISVVIPTLNAGTVMEHLLSGLAEQDEKPLETIIVDSSSNDNTVGIAKGFGARTMVIPRESFNHGKTRNAAAGEAKGDTLVFMTQDALPCDNTLLGNLTAPLKSGESEAAYGRHVPGPDASPPEIFARRFNYPESPLIKSMDDLPRYGMKTFFFSNVCSAVRRDAFLKVGMFPEDLRSNEDMLLAAKMLLNGYRVAYVPGAAVIHSHTYSLLRLFKRYYNIGSSLRNNKWILKYAHSEGEGVRFIKEEFSFLLQRRQYSWIPYIFLEAMAKYAGYRTGLIAG
jgi:rhamnosyltransferase